MLTWTDPVVCDGADTGPQGPLLASPHRSPGKRGVAVPSASLGSPPPSFLVYQAQGVSACGGPNPGVCPCLCCKGCWESKPRAWLPQWEAALPLTETHMVGSFPDSTRRFRCCVAPENYKSTLPPHTHPLIPGYHCVALHHHLPTTPHTLSQTCPKL